MLDANVLYPQWLRDVMLTLAAMGYFDPVWSQQIIDEMRRNVLHDHPAIDPIHFDEVTIAALRYAPSRKVDVDDELIADMDNAPDDRHVLAAAIAGTAPGPRRRQRVRVHVGGLLPPGGIAAWWSRDGPRERHPEERPD